MLDPLLLPNLILSSSLSSDARVNDYKDLSTPSENGSKSEKISKNKEKSSKTRMHSSRMRTGRSLIVCRSLLRGGVSSWGGCLLWLVSASGGVSTPGGRGWGCLLWGVSAPAGVSAPGGVCSGGCLFQGGVCSGGCLLPRVVVASQHALRQTPLLTE